MKARLGAAVAGVGLLGASIGAPMASAAAPQARAVAPVTTRIVGGTAADRSDTGWYAILQSDPDFLCGGTVVASTWILTAAHCVATMGTLRRAAAFVNPTSFDRFRYRPSGAAPVRWKKVRIHPGYVPSRQINDFALINTRERMTGWTMPYSADATTPANGDELTAYGFGQTSFNGRVSRVLRQVTVRDLSGPAAAGSCRAFDVDDDAATSFDPVSMLCAGLPQGGKDACNGDSGGPLLGGGGTRVVGIVSWGVGCADATFPGVYSRVSSAASWIQSITGIAPDTPSQPVYGRGYITASRGCAGRCLLRAGRSTALRVTNVGGRPAPWRIRAHNVRAIPAGGILSSGQSQVIRLRAIRFRGWYRLLQGTRAVT